MIKKVSLGLLMLILLISLFINWKFASLLKSNEFRNKVPNWNFSEYEILKKAYIVLAENEEFPINIYPYEIIKTELGYIIKFQALEYLQIGSGLFMYVDIYDGCIYYHFNSKMNLIDVTNCG